MQGSGAQVPCWQKGVDAGQTWPQLPQFFGSLSGLIEHDTPSQQMRPGVQAGQFPPPPPPPLLEPLDAPPLEPLLEPPLLELALEPPEDPLLEPPPEPLPDPDPPPSVEASPPKTDVAPPQLHNETATRKTAGKVRALKSARMFVLLSHKPALASTPCRCRGGSAD